VTRILHRPKVLGIDGENAIAECRLLTEIIQVLWSRGPRGARSNARASQRLPPQ
jgi:hypothetical protein